MATLRTTLVMRLILFYFDFKFQKNDYINLRWDTNIIVYKMGDKEKHPTEVSVRQQFYYQVTNHSEMSFYLFENNSITVSISILTA